MLARLRRRAFTPPLPSIILSNVRSVNNKTDELKYLTSNFRDYKDCSAFCLTETWLHPDTPDSIMCPDGFKPHRADRSNVLAQKSGLGGGICFLVNQRWCNDSTEIFRSCSHDLETLFIECKPFYSPREFSSIIMAGVYIPDSHPDAVAALASQINNIESSHPDSLVIVLGDFNRTSLSKELPKYKQQVKCSTHEDGNILDHCYCKIKDAYRVLPRPPLGCSDHNMLFLIPNYRQKLKCVKPIVKTVKCVDDDSIQRLNSCFDMTDWSVFKNASTSDDEYADTVSSYIDFCQDSCISTKTIKIYNNNKPWFSRDIKEIINKKSEAFKNNDKVEMKKCHYDLQKAIKRAKLQYAKKLENKFNENNTRSVWEGLQSITNYKQKSANNSSSDNAATPDSLNEFYSRFDKLNQSGISQSFYTDQPPSIVIETHEVESLFKKQNPRKAPGPDGVLTTTLRHCASVLAPVFTDIFNQSLTSQCIPICFKTSTIIPVLKSH